MKTQDEILKIKAVVVYILKAMPEGVDYIHLFKTMYFAQQEHLVLYGSPIMEDSFVARKHGPVPALTYKVLRGKEGKLDLETAELQDFAKDICLTEHDGHQTLSLSEGAVCDMDELSGSNVKVLDKWIDKCKGIEPFELSTLSHDQAWQKAKREHELTGEAILMPLYEIAKAGNASQAMLDVIRERQSVKCALR